MDIYEKAEAILSTDARFDQFEKDGDILTCRLDDGGHFVHLTFGPYEVQHFANLYDDQT